MRLRRRFTVVVKTGRYIYGLPCKQTFDILAQNMPHAAVLAEMKRLEIRDEQDRQRHKREKAPEVEPMIDHIEEVSQVWDAG